MQPDLSIIIINWNTCDLLANCLDSIAHTRGDLDLEIIVIDNASDDGSQAMIRQRYPHVRLIANQANTGFARANNQGLAVSQGRYSLLLNSDTIVLPGSLPALVDIADNYTDSGIIGCKLLNSDGSLQESWASFPTFWSEILGRNFRAGRLVDETHHLYDVDWVGGACLLVRPAAIEAVGGLDESFFMYSEEVDWCFRMRQQGWQVYYLASAKIIHLGGGSASRASTTQLIRLYESKIRFFAKHYGTWQATLLRYSLVFVNILSIFRRTVVSILQQPGQEAIHPWVAARWQFIGHLVRGRRTDAG